MLNRLRSRVATLEAAPGAGGGGVSSFNGRTGAVGLSGSDVTGALGYSPVTPAQFATALTVTDNSAAWGATAVRMASVVHSWTFGDERVQATTTIFPEGFEFDLSTGTGSSGAFGAAPPGGCFFNAILNAHNRVPFGVYGTVTGWEFNATPYVNNDAIYHAGNLSPLQQGNNLSDVASALAARTNLGLGSAATHASTDFQPAGSYLTGNQTITLTGDISGSGATAIATSIGANRVTRAMLAAAAGATILGATAAGNVADLTAAQAKTILAIAAGDVSGLAATATSTSAANLTGTLNAAQMPALTGDVTTSAGAVATTIGAGTVTLAKMANMATASLIYRKTASAGAPEVNSLATLKTDLGLTGTNSGDQTISLTGDVTGSGTGSFAATIAAGAVSLAKMANLAANSIIGNNTGSAATPVALTAAQTKSLLAIAESDVANLTTDLAAKAPLASPQFTGVAYYQQAAPTAKTTTGTLTIAELLTLIITATSSTAVTLTLPTGTLTDAGILSGALAVNEAFEWYLINLGSSSGAVTLGAGTAHTIVGNAVVAISTSARFLTRKTATNTFVTYRIA